MRRGAEKGGERQMRTLKRVAITGLLALAGLIAMAGPALAGRGNW
jgi:hypothetical protein